MYKWILHCLVYQKTVFAISILLLIVSVFGLRYLEFDYKMSVKKEVGTSQTVVLVAVYDKKLLDVLHLKRLASLQKELSEISAVKK